MPYHNDDIRKYGDIKSEQVITTENLKRCQLPLAVKLFHNWNWKKKNTRKEGRDQAQNCYWMNKIKVS